MKKDYYIFNSGELKKKDFNIVLITENESKIIPINTVSNIFIYSKIKMNSDLINYVGTKNISIHFFNYYGKYTNSLFAIDSKSNGNVHLKQAKYYIDYNERLYLAKQFILGSTWHIYKNLSEYNIEFDFDIYKEKIENVTKIDELMGIEGNIRKKYYRNFNKILNRYKFHKRTKRPPEDEINCLISFGNSLCYNHCLNAIKETNLSSSISYLHECSERRHSLSLDISEIFKPIYIDKVIFRLVNKNTIKDSDFTKEKSFCYLNETGKKKFLKDLEEKMNTKFYSRKLKKNISYKSLMKMECYKISKHLLEIDIYKHLKLDR